MGEPTIPAAGSGRLVSLDAYRGFIMLAMASSGLGLSRVAKDFPDSKVWQFLGYQTDHVAWAGCSFWDLIQPSFMFMVSIASSTTGSTFLIRTSLGPAFVDVSVHISRSRGDIATFRSLTTLASMMWDWHRFCR